MLLDILFISADLLAAFYKAVDVPEVYILAYGLKVVRSIIKFIIIEQVNVSDIVGVKFIVDIRDRGILAFLFFRLDTLSELDYIQFFSKLFKYLTRLVGLLVKPLIDSVYFFTLFLSLLLKGQVGLGLPKPAYRLLKFLNRVGKYIQSDFLLGVLGFGFQQFLSYYRGRPLAFLLLKRQLRLQVVKGDKPYTLVDGITD